MLLINFNLILGIPGPNLYLGNTLRSGTHLFDVLYYLERRHITLTVDLKLLLENYHQKKLYLES